MWSAAANPEEALSGAIWRNAVWALSLLIGTLVTSNSFFARTKVALLRLHPPYISKESESK